MEMDLLPDRDGHMDSNEIAISVIPERNWQDAVCVAYPRRRDPHIPKMGIVPKINLGKVNIFRAGKVTVNLPAFTSNPPQIHQQKTTFCTPFLPKPPAKTR
jgi:hypothetical protein